jgi:hypothetical protein
MKTGPAGPKPPLWPLPERQSLLQSLINYYNRYLGLRFATPQAVMGARLRRLRASAFVRDLICPSFAFRPYFAFGIYQSNLITTKAKNRLSGRIAI